MIKQAGMFLVCSSISIGLAAQSLTDAIEMTLRTNPDILVSKYGVEAAQQLHKQAKGAYLPSVDLALAGGYENSDNTTTRATPLNEIDLTKKEKSLKVTQLLYDGFATSNLIKQQSALIDSAAARLGSSQENVSLRAVQVYLEMLRRKKIVDLTQENLNQHEQTLSKIEERFGSGVGTKVDVVQTRGRRAQSKSNLLLAERDVKNGNAEFFRVVGEHPQEISEPAVVKGLPGTLDEAIQSAMMNNHGLKAAEADLLAAIAGKKQVRGSYHPRFDLEIGASRNADTDGVVGENNDETAVIRMSYNLYRGGADKARENEAEAREFAARETVRSIRRAVEENVTLIWNELEDILQRLEYLEAHVTSTEEVLVVYNEQLSLGKRTLLDLLDIQNELLRARVAYISGQYSEKLARYRVLASTGRMLETMGIEPEN